MTLDIDVFAPVLLAVLLHTTWNAFIMARAAEVCHDAFQMARPGPGVGPRQADSGTAGGRGGPGRLDCRCGEANRCDQDIPATGQDKTWQGTGRTS